MNEILERLGLVLGLVAVLEFLYACILFVTNRPMPAWLRLSLFRVNLSRFQWYRKWYGGRWEYWFIEMCMSAMWLNMSDKYKYPDHFPCSGRGTPIIEDY